MNSRAAAATTWLVLAMTVPLTGTAAAGPPQRECPLPFELTTFDEHVELVQEKLGLSEEEARALAEQTFALIDRNGDRLLCFAFQNRVKGAPNIIDNAAVRRDRGAVPTSR
jgi:hypothetical protein